MSNPENPRRDRELVIVGSEPVGIALAKLAKVLGFTVTVVDPFLKPAHVPGADQSLNSLDFSLLPAAAARYVDMFTMEPDKIKDVYVMWTVVGGKEVYKGF